MNNEWQERIRPLRLERRYEFPDYNSLRNFLDEAAELSEREGMYPDMGFGRDYVNVTIHSDENTTELGDAHRRLAAGYDVLFVARSQG